jgi:hypothetical protein
MTMQLTETHNGTWRVVLLAALIVALLGLTAAVADSADDRATRIDRKVRVMERVFDEVLVQSQNVAVGPGGVTRGVVLDEFGALFTLEASVGKGYVFALPEVPEVPGVGMEDALIRVAPRPMRGPRGDGEQGEEFESWEEWQKEVVAKRKEKYAAFKVELIDTVIDYGSTLTELADDQWVAVLAFLDGSRLLGGGSSERRLMVKIRMRDLRQYSAGSLSREAAVKRVTVTES